MAVLHLDLQKVGGQSGTYGLAPQQRVCEAILPPGRTMISPIGNKDIFRMSLQQLDHLPAPQQPHFLSDNSELENNKPKAKRQG